MGGVAVAWVEENTVGEEIEGEVVLEEVEGGEGAVGVREHAMSLNLNALDRSYTNMLRWGEVQTTPQLERNGHGYRLGNENWCRRVSNFQDPNGRRVTLCTALPAN